MARNGSGTYVLPSGNPVVTGTSITSNWANTTLSDVATALTGSVASDGQTPMTGALQMGNNKITGLANGTLPTDAATVNQISNPNITGGSIDGTPIGNISRSTGKFTTLDVSSGAALLGTCTAPTVTPGTDNTTKIATTAFVQSAIAAVSSGVTSFNTRTGVVTLTSGDVTTALGYTPYNAGGATVITTGNISSYAPGLTGSGASGNWGINITGSSANATTATTATNVSGGSVNATTGSFSSTVASTQFNVTGGGFLGPQSVAIGNGTTGIYNTGSSNFGFQSGGSSILFIAAGTGSVTNISGSYTAISDERVKENITPAPNYLNDLCQLNVVNYNLLGKTDKYLGLIAQEVQTVLPGLVEANAASEAYPDVPNLLSVKYSVLVPMLLQAVQELKAGLDAANAEIAALKGA